MPETPAIAQPLAPRLLHDAAAMFAMLSARVRLQMLWLLADGEHDGGTLVCVKTP